MKTKLIGFLLLWAVTAQAQTTNLPSGIGITFAWTNSTSVGSSLSWQLSLTNSASSSLTCRVSMDANALAYNGKFLGDITTTIITNTLATAATTNLFVEIAPSAYTNWTSKTRTFELTAYVYVQGAEEHWVGAGRTVMTTTSDILSVSPTPPIQQNQSLTGTVSYLNPLPVALHNVNVSMTADEGLSTNAAITESTWNIGTVATNSWITVSTNYTAGQIGTCNISAIITADELDEVEGSKEVEVVAP